MAGTETWAGWIRFGAIMLMIIATLDFFQGLIAVIRSEYYVLAPNQIIVFDTTTWGWITIIWAIILFITGLGLGQGASWARWTTIVVCSLGFLVQLGFVGSAAYPLWALTVVALYLIVLYAIVVRWDDAGESVRRTAESRM
ncbi:MAG TPA: hypothetical protein VH297_03585 [Gaiellaceae bacterium]|jgi:hypothetical protein